MLPAACHGQAGRQPCNARRRRRSATNRTGCRNRLITISEHVVPRPRSGANFRAYSITYRRALLKTGEKQNRITLGALGGFVRQ